MDDYRAECASLPPDYLCVEEDNDGTVHVAIKSEYNCIQLKHDDVVRLRDWLNGWLKEIAQPVAPAGDREAVAWIRQGALEMVQKHGSTGGILNRSQTVTYCVPLYAAPHARAGSEEQNDGRFPDLTSKEAQRAIRDGFRRHADALVRDRSEEKS